MHVLIIDVNYSVKTHIFNGYWPFNPTNNQSQRQFFESQLSIKNNTTFKLVFEHYNFYNTYIK